MATTEKKSSSAGAIGYLNPERDYYSQVLGNLAKKITVNKNANLTLSTAFNYALDRETMIGSTQLEQLKQVLQQDWHLEDIEINTK